jgi:signal transduction histidine kinase/HD-GYP domain-containing protein (c-di-GMP phosphodiesterase class II)
MALDSALSSDGRPGLEGGGLDALSQVLLALRSTADLATACAIAGECAVRALGAADHRVVRIDARSGMLSSHDASGASTPWLAEPGGPLEYALREGRAVFDEGEDPAAPREDNLWSQPTGALAVVPLVSGGLATGFLLLQFAAPRTLGPADRLFLQALGDALALALARGDLEQARDEERRCANNLQRRVSESEEASSSLMSVVAHEIRTPLTAIKAYTEALLENIANPQTPRQRFLGIINEECDRLARLVTDILDLSRLEAGQRPLRLARVQLLELVHETLEGLQPMARSRQATLEAQVEPTLAPEADPDLIRRLLINLLTNAIKHSPAGGTVRVEAGGLGDEWWVAVEDDGPGIAVADVPHVFERFYRARHPGDGEKPEGTGLGLAISRGIVELHGGRISFENRASGGARFEFWLPLRQLASGNARRLARLVLGRADLRALLDQTIEMVAASMDAEIASLMLVDPEHGDLFVAAARGLDPQQLQGRRTPVRSGVAGAVAAWGRPLLVDNIETDRRFRRLNHPQYHTKSLLCVPLRVAGEVLGVVNVNNKRDGAPFDDDDLTVLSALVDRVGSALDRACAHPDSDRVVDEALELVRSVTRLRREHLLGSHEAVHLSRALARELGLAPSDADLVGYAASIHDLGMTRLTGALEDGEGLGEEERRALERHPEVSVQILRPLEYLGSVRDVILGHHERWDGSGYPRGLAGAEIPVGARILAVVDAWESMTHGRPWRPARSHEEAMAELSRAAGTQFDPTVVEAFLRVLAKESDR